MQQLSPSYLTDLYSNNKDDIFLFVVYPLFGVTGFFIVFLCTFIFIHRWRFVYHGNKKNPTTHPQALSPSRDKKGGQHLHQRARVIAFFHPYCASGGGGERVLWAIIKALGEIHKEGLRLKIIIYTIDPPTQSYKEDVLKHAQERFAIKVSSSVDLSFIHLHEYAYLLEPASRFSMLVESWRAMRLAYIALKLSASAEAQQQQHPEQQQQQHMPKIFFDTTGYAFTYPVASLLFGCQVISYTHYPTISTDMLSLVWERRRSTYNNQHYITSSRLTTYIKLIYYSFFALAYGVVGSFCSLVMVNSTWTYNHINSLWFVASIWNRICIIYPPCRVQNYNTNSTTTSNTRERIILSIGQFRPEKDHELQIESLSLLFKKHPELKSKNIKLALIGSCRGKNDEDRLQYLKDFALKKHNLIENQQIEFIVNQPYDVIEQYLKKASIGIHTMWNEHFGIGIVEMMSAGLAVIAHNSGGPKTDIIVDYEEYDSDDGGEDKIQKKTGFLACTVDEYTDCIHQIFTMNEKDLLEIRNYAKLSSQRFTDEVFLISVKRSILESGILR